MTAASAHQPGPGGGPLPHAGQARVSESPADEVSPDRARADVLPPDPPSPPVRLTVPLLLAAGWGALLAFSLTILMEDGRNAAVAERSAARETLEARAPFDRDAAGLVEARIVEPRASAGRALGEATPGAPAPALGEGIRLVSVAAAAEAAPGARPSQPSGPPDPRSVADRPDYVGTWGPNAAACGTASRRRGFLPATISEGGARAGRTQCRFRNGRRDGIAWAVAAECREHGRQWISQVRLLVDGDRLTWTSAKGAATYVRCGRRDG